MDLSYFGIALGTLFLSKRNSTKKSMELFGHWIGNSLVIGLGTIGHWIGNSLVIGLGTIGQLDGELFGHWIGNSWTLDQELLGIGLGTCLSLGKRCKKVNRTDCRWIGELVDFGRWHVHQSQWDTICQGSGRCGWMKPFFCCFSFT
jgi:hypothetical protein